VYACTRRAVRAYSPAMTDDVTTRFSARADAYQRARPGYPAALVERACELGGLEAGHAIADVGAGTGKLTERLIGRFARVVALEPNASMREVLATRLDVEVGAGSAEATGLPDGDVDGIAAAQAFHWFDPARTFVEWSRVLRGPRAALLLWNDRQVDTPFGAALAALLATHQTESRTALGHAGASRDARLAGFVDAGALLRDTVRERHALVLDRDALDAWTASVSYLPRAGAPGHAAMIAALQACFDEHQQGGRVKLDFDAIAYVFTLPRR